jgi:hypothetical protein
MGMIIQQVHPDDPRLVDHPMRNKTDWQKRAVPALLFGDHVPWTKYHGMTCLLWSFLLCSLPVWDNVFLTVCFPKQCCAHSGLHGDDTMVFLWRMVVFSLNYAFRGEHPTRDLFGHAWPAKSKEAIWAEDRKLICQGVFFLVIWAIVADLDYLCNDLHLPHFNSFSCCFLCQANRGPNNVREAGGSPGGPCNYLW